MKLHLEGITKRYRANQVLRQIDVQFRKGERALLLGRNGAGKSTLLRVCAGLLRPDSGRIFLDSSPVERLRMHEIGHCGHQPMLYAELSVYENLRLLSKLYGAQAKTEEALDLYLQGWELSHVRDVRVSNLSKGLQARASLARALVANPSYIFFDEPTSSLDDYSTQVLLNFLSELPQSLILIASHDVSRLLDFVGRILVLDGGKIVMDSSSGVSLQDAVGFYRSGNR